MQKSGIFALTSASANGGGTALPHLATCSASGAVNVLIDDVTARKDVGVMHLSRRKHALADIERHLLTDH